MTKDITLAPGEIGYFRAPEGERFDTLWMAPGGRYVKVRATDTAQPDPEPEPDPIPDPEPPTPTAGILTSAAELASKPTSGKAWDALKAAADGSTAWTLASQDSGGSTTILAAALVYARTGDAKYRDKVIAQLKAGMTTKPDRTLALARELPSGVIAADLVGYRELSFVGWLEGTIDSSFDGKTLGEMTWDRPNNWGTHGQGALAAAYAYLGAPGELDALHRLVRGWLGDRSAYSGFAYGDLAWQADPTKPVGINPRGATKSGHSIDGVLPDDQRRGGGFTWPPPKENYVWEALQGVVLAAHILERTGRPVWSLSDKAILRAVTWLYEVCQFPPTGDDSWIPVVINRAYGTSFPVASPTSPGKNVAFPEFWA